jgi:hypothetical protein
MPKAFLQCPDGRLVSPHIIEALGAIPLDECPGAEYRPLELIMWVGGE